jgi:hypothetical protein
VQPAGDRPLFGSDPSQEAPTGVTHGKNTTDVTITAINSNPIAIAITPNVCSVPSAEWR